MSGLLKNCPDFRSFPAAVIKTFERNAIRTVGDFIKAKPSFILFVFQVWPLDICFEFHFLDKTLVKPRFYKLPAASRPSILGTTDWGRKGPRRSLGVPITLPGKIRKKRKVTKPSTMQNEKVTDFKTVYQVTELKKKLLKGSKTVPGAAGVSGDLAIDRYAAHI